MGVKAIEIFHGEMTEVTARANKFLSELRGDDVVSVTVEDLGLKVGEVLAKTEDSRLLNITVLYLRKEKNVETGYDAGAIKKLVTKPRI